MTYVLRTRLRSVFAPMRCADCKQVLTLGMQYMSGHGGREKCMTCFKKGDTV